MGKLNASEINFWLSEARSCEQRQQQELLHRNNYPFLINYYEGFDRAEAPHPHLNTHQRLAIINEHFPNTNALISEIMYQNPDIVVDAAKPEAEEGEDLMKAALSYWFDKSHAIVENRVALFDMLYSGIGCIEVGQYNPGTGSKKDLLPSEQDLAKRKTLMERATGIFKRKDEKAAEEALEKAQPPKESSTATNTGTYIRRWDPVNVPLDWRAERIIDRRYNLKKVWMSPEEFNITYPKFAGRVTDSNGRFRYSMHEKESRSGKMFVYEFQIKKKDGSYWNLVIAPSILEEELDMFKRPYVTNGFDMKIGTLHKYGRLYPTSMAQINKKMSDEMNEYIRFQAEVAKRNIPKYLVDGKKIKHAAKESLKSTKVNDIVEADGPPTGTIIPLVPTPVSNENKEQFALFQTRSEKGWGVSTSRLQGKANEKFATGLKIQEAGFQEKTADIQEGLRFFIQEQLDSGKDLIATFWDKPIFFKITGKEKMSWYEPQTAVNPMTGQEMVLNPLSDLLTGDYWVKVDISSALRPNKERKRNEAILFIKELAGLLPLFQAQGKTINTDEIAKISKQFGFTPEVLFVDAPPPPDPNAVQAGEEQISPEEDAERQAEAERRANAGV